MTIPKYFPNSEWVGSMRTGKEWRGETAPILVIHTLEGGYWPSPTRWESPAHIVCNPNTGEVKQYISMNKAAYSVRDNALEDDYPTWQVELWGYAANVPNYSDKWYQGVADLFNTFHSTYGIPKVFADFSRVAVDYPGATPDRMTDEEVRAFSGFLGHCHVGLDVDTHWDPGRLDTDKVLSYMGAAMPKTQWHQMIDALFIGRPDEFRGDPNYWKNEVPEDSPEWTDFWAAFVRVIEP